MNNGYLGRSPGDSAVSVARQIFQPTSSQSAFTFASGYDVNYFDVYLNGAKQIKGIDYTASDGKNFTFVTAVHAGDVVEGVAYKAFNLGQATVGISSNGTTVGNVQNLNFIGTGNTFTVNGETIEVSIAGGGGDSGKSGVGTAIKFANNTDSPFSYINATVNIAESIVLDTTNAGADDSYVVVQEPRIVVNPGVAVTVGVGKTLVTDLYQLGDL
jgi:hypothetical protein